MILTQIKDYYGKIVEIRQKDKVIHGTLAYFHFDNQTITLNNVSITDADGNSDSKQMLLLNKDDWNSICSLE